jgi:hypothetical protein
VLDFRLVDVLQRPDWYGSPVELGELFILKKNGREATCKLRSHQFGWELLLFVGQQLEVVQSQVCRSQDDVLTTGEQWKAAMVEKGWQAQS